MKIPAASRAFRALKIRVKCLDFISGRETLNGFSSEVTNVKPHFRKLNLWVNCRIDSGRKTVRDGKTSQETLAVLRRGDKGQSLRDD